VRETLLPGTSFLRDIAHFLTLETDSFGLPGLARISELSEEEMGRSARDLPARPYCARWKAHGGLAAGH
jgi:hypothetical protein